jgi:hypothetical protein
MYERAWRDALFFRRDPFEFYDLHDILLVFCNMPYKVHFAKGTLPNGANHFVIFHSCTERRKRPRDGAANRNDLRFAPPARRMLLEPLKSTNSDPRHSILSNNNTN